MGEHSTVNDSQEDALHRAITTGERPVIEAAARTDVGVHRRVNEDAVLAENGVYIVADGMGGHEAGDLASAAAIGPFAELAADPRVPDFRVVEATIERSRNAVDAVSMQTERGAGCTLTGVVLIEHEGAPHWYVLNVGDSRVYLHRGAQLTQLTADHSLQAELLAEGRAEAASTPRNVITRALGSDDSRHDAWLLPVHTGTRLLVCSDGLTTEVPDDEIRAVLTIGGRPAPVADELIRLAREGGGRDNISAIVVDTVTAGSAEAAGEAGALDAHEDVDTAETLEVTRPVRR